MDSFKPPNTEENMDTEDPCGDHCFRQHELDGIIEVLCSNVFPYLFADVHGRNPRFGMQLTSKCFLVSSKLSQIYLLAILRLFAVNHAGRSVAQLLDHLSPKFQSRSLFIDPTLLQMIILKIMTPLSRIHIEDQSSHMVSIS